MGRISTVPKKLMVIGFSVSKVCPPPTTRSQTEAAEILTKTPFLFAKLNNKALEGARKFQKFQ